MDIDDEAKTSHEANLEKLEDLAVNAEFESGTLVGDIRDLMLRLYKERAKNWSQCSAQEQRDIVHMATDVAKKVIRKTARVIAEEDQVAVHATLKGYNAGEGFDIKLKANSDEENALQLFRMQGHEVILISADAKKFDGQRKDADVEEDQAPLPFSDARPEPEMSDDSDLAGEFEIDEALVSDGTTLADDMSAAGDILKGDGTGLSESLIPEIETAYQPVDDDGNDITPEQEKLWSTVTYVTAKQPEAPSIGQSWVKPAEGKIKYWHGSKWYVGKPVLDADGDEPAEKVSGDEEE